MILALDELLKKKKLCGFRCIFYMYVYVGDKEKRMVVDIICVRLYVYIEYCKFAI